FLRIIASLGSLLCVYFFFLFHLATIYKHLSIIVSWLYITFSFSMMPFNVAPSTSTSPVSSTSSMVSCTVCNKYFTQRGINIHIVRSHPSEDSIEDFNSSVQAHTTNDFSLEEPNTFVSCPHCPQGDNRIFRGARGLRIHHARVHSDICDSTKVMPASCANLSDSPLQLKKTVRVLHRIPKGARSSAADRLQSLINICISTNDDHDWSNLMLFAYSALRVPDKNINKSLVSKIKDNISNFRLPDTPENTNHKKTSPHLAYIHSIERQIAAGNVRKAVRVLSSDVKIAENNQDTLDELISKHPSPLAH
ncbi:hypothetical protein C0J52_09731, partial [Blattella germanica]